MLVNHFVKYRLFSYEDYQGGIADYNKTIELDHNYKFAYNNRGDAKSELGDQEGACLDWIKAGVLGHIDFCNIFKKLCN